MKQHLFAHDYPNKKILFMRNYYRCFKHLLKCSNDKIIGKGPKTYRYHCDDPKFITFYEDKEKIIDNTI